MKLYTLCLLLLITSLSCIAQKNKKTTTMKTTERFDVQYYKSKIKEVNGKDGDNSFAIYVDIEIVHRLRCILIRIMMLW